MKFVISIVINQFETNVSQITIYCLRLFVVGYKNEMMSSKLVVYDKYVPSFIVISITINQLRINISLIMTYCLRMFDVIHKEVTLSCLR